VSGRLAILLLMALLVLPWLIVYCGARP